MLKKILTYILFLFCNHLLSQVYSEEANLNPGEIIFAKTGDYHKPNVKRIRVFRINSINDSSLIEELLYNEKSYLKSRISYAKNHSIQFFQIFNYNKNDRIESYEEYNKDSVIISKTFYIRDLDQKVLKTIRLNKNNDTTTIKYNYLTGNNCIRKYNFEIGNFNYFDVEYCYNDHGKLQFEKYYYYKQNDTILNKQIEHDFDSIPNFEFTYVTENINNNNNNNNKINKSIQSMIQYDENNKEVKSFLFDKNGTLISESNYSNQYDKYNNLIERTMKSTNYSFHVKYVIEYY